MRKCDCAKCREKSSIKKPTPITELTGIVVRPTDSSYEDDRQNLIQLHQSFPYAIVFAQNATDVINAIKFSRENDISFRLRCGRSSMEGWCGVTNGITIDVSQMNEMKIDSAQRLVTCGAGVTVQQLTNALNENGFFTSTCREGMLGMLPTTLGGGISLLSRIKGLSCANLVGLKTVLAHGNCSAKVIEANLSKNVDLLNASRGAGGGNFGAVVEFTMQIHVQPEFVVVWSISFPFDEFVDVFDMWQHWAPVQDGKVSSQINCFRNRVDIEGIFIGNVSEMDAILTPLMELPNGISAITQMTFSSYYQLSSNSESPFIKFSPMIPSRVFPRAAIQIITEFMSNAPSLDSNFQAVALGAAAKVVPKGGWSIPFSKSPFYSQVSARWSDSSIDSIVFNWIQAFRLSMNDFFTFAYVNVPLQEIAEFEIQYYGKNKEKLMGVKKKYDPHDIFHFEQSIKTNRSI
jgi:hypothetical protein